MEQYVIFPVQAFRSFAKEKFCLWAVSCLASKAMTRSFSSFLSFDLPLLLFLLNAGVPLFPPLFGISLPFWNLPRGILSRGGPSALSFSVSI